MIDMMDTIIFTSNGWCDRYGIRHSAQYGQANIGYKQKEGDNVTPIGDYNIRYILYRPDRVAKPDTNLVTKPLCQHDAWCDDAEHAFYNRLVFQPFKPSHELLWRHDNLYNIIMILSYNDSPPILGRGSAIFIHLAHEERSYTAGCIALKPDVMKHFITHIHSKITITVTG